MPKNVPTLNTFNDAFLISPIGEAVQVETSHIDLVCSYPEKFGFTRSRLQTLFDSYDEPLGWEGDARIKVLRALIRHGWIRTRRYKNSGWTVNVWGDSQIARGKASPFFALLLTRNPDILLDEVRLDTPGGVERLTVQALVNDQPPEALVAVNHESAEFAVRFMSSPRDLSSPPENASILD